MTQLDYDATRKSADYIAAKIDDTPEVALILGSGLGPFADNLEDPVIIPYQDIPNFPSPTIPGHEGRLVVGSIDGVKVLAMQGRFHTYEGYQPAQVIFPVRVMSLLNIERLLVTNAAGAVNRKFSPGDLMLITDHINLMGRNPLLGPNEDRFGPRFQDLSSAYHERINLVIQETAEEEKVELQQGVYLAVSGPTYETPAEIRMFGTLGADACGMSTVPEVIAANHCGMIVGGISCLTNMGAGLSDTKLDHTEVTETANLVMDKFTRLIRSSLPGIASVEV